MCQLSNGGSDIEFIGLGGKIVGSLCLAGISQMLYFAS